MAPFFLAHGLMKGSYIGTDALLTVFMQLLDRLPAWVFTLVIELTLVIAGLDLLLRG
jgi:hypothetical protein